MWKTLRAVTALGTMALLLATGATFTPRTAHGASAPTFASTETRITYNPLDQYDPAISGNLITYTDLRGSDANIYYYDLMTQQEHQVTNAAGNQALSDVSGGLIVYSDMASRSLVLYDTSDGVSTYLSQGPETASLHPAISGQTVVWQDYRDGTWEIYGKDLDTGEVKPITDDPAVDYYPDVSGNMVVWQRCPAANQCQIMAYDWTSGTSRQLTDLSTGDAEQPSVSGHRVVYQVNRNGEQDICAFDLSASTNPETCLSRPGPQINPNISGDYVAFEDSSSGTSHIMLWDVAHNAVFDVTGADPGAQYLNDIDGNRIVYTDNRNGQLDIYMSTFTITYPPSDTTPPVLALPAPITADATGPQGATITYTVTATDQVDGAVTPNCTPASGSLFPIGATTVTCTATDAAGNSAQGSFTVTVKGATDQISDLTSAVQSINLKQGIANSLDAKLQNVQAALTAANAGNRQNACNAMDAFINEAQAQAGNAITSADADQLLAAAQRIKAVMSCPA